MRIFFVSPRAFGLMATPGTYQLVEAYARHATVRVVSDSRKNASDPIVYAPSPNLDLIEVPFRSKDFKDQILVLAKAFDPDILCLACFRFWHELAERLRHELPTAKFVLDIKSPIVEDDVDIGKRIRESGIRYAQSIDLILSRCKEDVETWIPGCTRPVKIYPLGVETSSFSPRVRSGDDIKCSRFVFIGSYYIRQRQLGRMVNFIARLPDPIKAGVTFDMFGDGASKGELIELVRTRGLESIVRVNGVLPQAELFKILPEYDAGLAWVPRAIYDAAPSLKILEYFGSGLGVVASATTAHRRNVDEGFRAILFEENSESFSDAIRQAADTGIPRSDIERNLELIKRRDWDRVVADHLLPAFDELLRTAATETLQIKEAMTPTMPRGAVKEIADLPTANGGANRSDAAGTFSRMLVWSPDLPVPPVATKPHSRLRIACILSDRLFEGLVHEAELLLLTQATWKQTLQFGRADMLLIESTWSTATGDWYMAQLPGGEERDRLGALLRFAQSLAIPTVFWMTQDNGYLHLYQELAARFDRVFCADALALTGLAQLGVHATLLPPAIQPRRFNPIKTIDDGTPEKPGIVYDGWSDLYKFPEIRAVLARLPPQSLSIIDTSAMLARPQIARLPEPQLRRALKGWVHCGLLPEIYKRADAYISFSQSTLPPTQASWALVEAAGCRVPPIHLGALNADDFRTNFVRRWGTPEEFLGDIDEVMGDPLARELAAHRSWREAYGKHTFADRLAVICREVGVCYDWEPFPRVTLVTGTMRPNLLEKSVRQYLDQSYPNKELVIVFNGRLGELAAIQAKYRHRADIVFTALPIDRHAGSLLNFGVRQGTGKYFFRVDDDDHYGVNYIYDCMLHLRACDADVFGKQACFFHFEGEEWIYKRTEIPQRITQFEAKDIDLDTRRGLFFSGCSFACKSDLLKTITYPDDNNLSADTELLSRIKAARPDAQCLKVDSLNLVVERSADVEKHTWRQPAARLKQGSEMLDKTIDDLMV